MNRGVKSKSLLDNGLVQRQLGEVLPLQRGQIGTENLDLLLVELLHDLRVLGKSEHDPGAGRGRRVLASHEKGNHHVGNLVVGDPGTILVGGVHQMLHHVEFSVDVRVGSSFADGVHVDLGDSSLSVVTLAVPGERSPVEGEVDGGEAHVEIVVQGSEGLVKLVANDAALKSMGGGENGDFGHLLGDIGNARLALEVDGPLEVILDFTRDDGNVGSESIAGQGNLHELEQGPVSMHDSQKRPCLEQTFFCSMSLALGQS